MDLQELLSGLPPGTLMSPVPPAQVTGLSIDSRRVERGDLFVAMVGGSADGHDYVTDAISRGATAIVGEREMGRWPCPMFDWSAPGAP